VRNEHERRFVKLFHLQFFEIEYDQHKKIMRCEAQKIVFSVKEISFVFE
jgi:hypothetical protein